MTVATEPAPPDPVRPGGRRDAVPGRRPVARISSADMAVAPAPTGLRKYFRPEAEASLLQVATSFVLIVASAFSVRPIGASGTSLAVLVLLIVNCALLASRHTPERYVPERMRIGLLYSGALAAAGLIALGRGGTCAIFGFFVAGHAGFRLTQQKASWVALTCSVLCGGVLALGWGGGHWTTPWYVGAATGFSVLLGMVSRSRREAYLALLQAADFAERATQSEAREFVLAERGRIARDVHDVLAHSLAGISMQLNLANALLDRGDIGRAREVTGSAQDLVRDSLMEAQRTVRALRDENLPLVETLRAMAQSGAQAVDVEVEGTVRELATNVSQALIRVAQESLTNAYKHASGAEIRLRLAYQADAVALDVLNGPADTTRPLAVAGSGLGLVGMRERVALVGGALTAGPERGGGWRVHVTVAA